MWRRRLHWDYRMSRRCACAALLEDDFCNIYNEFMYMSGLVCVRESNWFSSCRRVRPTRAPVLNTPTNPPEPTRNPTGFPTAQPSISFSPTQSPQTLSPTVEVPEVISWQSITGFEYGINTRGKCKCLCKLTLFK